jgi:Raf kinase inhibitor-like YbhB/YbcL family protein
MQLTSPAFKHGGKIPSEYTCDGIGVSPELQITGVPLQAKSLVLIVEDPDVPEAIRKDHLWVHWVVFNIPPTHTHMPKNTQPPGVPGINTRGDLVYQGPCPPDREHRYFFILYALDTTLDLPEGATKTQVEQAMDKRIVARAELMGKYQRGK